MTDKLTPIERSLVAAASMPAQDARRVLMLICESGMRNVPDGTKPAKSLGEQHYDKREPTINRMQAACDRVLNYAKHETLRNIEKHFRETGMASAEEQEPAVVRLTFDKA